MDRDVPKGMAIILLLVGSIFFFGVTTYRVINNYNHRDYNDTQATFIQATEAPTAEDGTHMYYLTYQYINSGQAYYYTTDYSTSVIPKVGSSIKIKYNPNNPYEVYHSHFDVFSVFQIIGATFLFALLMILFHRWFWFKDIILFLSTSSIILTFIVNNLYTGGLIFVMIILGILCFASIMDFITNVKTQEFNPIKDIKEEIETSRHLKQKKKAAAMKITYEEKMLKKKKINKVIKGILLVIIPIPLVIFIEINFGYPNQVIYYIFVLIAFVCTVAGFFIAGITLTGMDSENTVLAVAGKVIDQETIKNAKFMTLKEKIEAFNIKGVVMRILLVVLFVAIPILIEYDPLKIFSNFESVGEIQLFSAIGMGGIATAYLGKSKHTKLLILIYVLGFIALYIIGYYNIIP